MERTTRMSGPGALGVSAAQHAGRKLRTVAILVGLTVVGCGGSPVAGTGAVAGMAAAAGMGVIKAGSGATAGAAAGTVAAAGHAAIAGMGSGAAGTSSTAGTGGGTAGAATFTAVLALFGQDAANCGICHATAANKANGSLMFNSNNKQATYDALVGKTSAGGVGSMCGGKTYVVPGKPAESLLYQKLSASPPCGMRMPQGMPPLSDAAMQTLSAWITAGANND
jgi:hypothetical protein